MYEDCPFKYKLRYHDNIKRDIEGVEGRLALSAFNITNAVANRAFVSLANSKYTIPIRPATNQVLCPRIPSNRFL